MKRLFVISDIHGQYEAFDRLLEKIQYDSEKDNMIVLGDMIDRGPDSASVVQRVIDEKMIAITGNHEDFLLEYMDGDLSWEVYSTPLFGGVPTIRSYKRLSDPINTMQDHLKFMMSLPQEIVADHRYLFVHEAYPAVKEPSGLITVSGHVSTERIALDRLIRHDGTILYDEKTKNIFMDCTGKKNRAKVACLELFGKTEHYVFIDNLEYRTRRCPADWI